MDIMHKRVEVNTLPGKHKFDGQSIQLCAKDIHPIIKTKGNKSYYCLQIGDEEVRLSKEVFDKLRKVERDFHEHPGHYRLMYDRKAFDRTYRNCTKYPNKYGSNAMFNFLFWAATELYHLMDEKYRVRMHLFGRDDAEGEDIGCICMHRCAFYFVNNRSDSPSPSFQYVKNYIIPKLHKKLKTSSKPIVLDLYTGRWPIGSCESCEWIVKTIQNEYDMYRTHLRNN